MMIYSPKVIMEIQYWFLNFLRNTDLNKNQIPYPSELKDHYFENDRSFIRLLFDDEWPKEFNSYNFMFFEHNLSTSSAKEIFNRICIYPNPIIYITGDNGNINVFNLKNDDFLMLDKLLDYRTGDSTSILDIEIDSTAEYETTLSNLINNYLDLMINKNYDSFDELEIKSDNLLTCLFEIYITEKMFNYVSSLGYS